MTTFALTILTAKSTVFEGHASHLGIVTDHGSRGFEAQHEAFLAVTSQGSVLTWVPTEGEARECTVGRALVRFRNNSCTVTGVTHEDTT